MQIVQRQFHCVFLPIKNWNSMKYFCSNRRYLLCVLGKFITCMKPWVLSTPLGAKRPLQFTLTVIFSVCMSNMTVCSLSAYRFSLTSWQCEYCKITSIFPFWTSSVASYIYFADIPLWRRKENLHVTLGHSKESKEGGEGGRGNYRMDHAVFVKIFQDWWKQYLLSEIVI